MQDRKAADRQRRYRERQRNAQTVTERNAVTETVTRNTPTQEEWDSLPAGVARPRPDSPAWVHGADYARTIWRLLHWTIDQLTQAGQWIPAWRIGWEAA